jgi:hypothetical protein
MTLQTKLTCADGGNRTALEIQRLYLEEAQRWVAARRPGDPESTSLVAAWREVLDTLPGDRSALIDRLDWVAKFDLMDQAVAETALRQVQPRLAGAQGTLGSGWDAVCRALAPIRYLEQKNLGLGRVCESPDEVRSFLQKRLGGEFAGLKSRMEHHGIAWETFPELYRLHYQLKKIDLKYHETGGEGGYYLQLEREGLFTRVLTDEEITEAIDRPPPRTRALARVRYMRDADRLELPIMLGWDRVFSPTHFKVIDLPDPLQTEIPLPLEHLTLENPLWTLGRLVFFVPRLLVPF